MNEKLNEKIHEALSSVLPITIIVLALSITIVPLEIGTISLFLTGALLLICGMGFFQLGVEMSMMPLGQGVGSAILQRRNLPIIMITCFFVGTIITVAEPDLQVLAHQVAAIPNRVIIWTVALGVGIFTVISAIRIFLKVSLSKILFILYALIFVLAFVSPPDFIAVAFDSGGVTTGPMTVPFIMALGIGLSAARSDKDGTNDSFGLIALCSVGPILMIMILGIFYNPSDAAYDVVTIPAVVTMRDVVYLFIRMIPLYFHEVMMSMLPVILVFLVFQLLTRRYHKRQLIKMSIGFLYTIIGLILFLTGVNVGFAPVGSLIGSFIAGGSLKYILIPIGILIGYFIVKAEPAVQVLNHQVEEIADGLITKSVMNISLSIGVASAVGLAMVRVLTGLNIFWIIIPGYLLALALTRFVPPIFVGIAFDSGGVASGPMTSTFLLPLTIGACTAAGGNVVTDAFGAVALVALAPLIAIQVVGCIYTYKIKKSTEGLTAAGAVGAVGTGDAVGAAGKPMAFKAPGAAKAGDAVEAVGTVGAVGSTDASGNPGVSGTPAADAHNAGDANTAAVLPDSEQIIDLEEE